MSTITITEPVIDETALRQAVAGARSGEVIWLASTVQLSAPLIIPRGANLTIEGSLTIDVGHASEIDGSIVVDAGAAVTIENVSVSEMNGSTLIGGEAVSPNPGPSWRAIGTGDFNDDSHSDILFQNTSTGQAAVWEMSGNDVIGGGVVTPNPGPSWKAIGTGDFNDDAIPTSCGRMRMARFQSGRWTGTL